MLKLTQFTFSSTLNRSIKTLSTAYYKSDIALDKIYPNSKQNIFTPPAVRLKCLNYFKFKLITLFLACN